MTREKGHHIDGGLGLLLVMVIGVVVGAALLVWNPLGSIEVGERTPRLLVFMRVTGGFMLVMALYRIMTWASWRVTGEALERRGWFGRKSFPRSELTGANLSDPKGLPPSYELRFRSGKARFVAKQLSNRDMIVLRTFADALAWREIEASRVVANQP